MHHEQRDHNILVDTALPKSVPPTSSSERPPKSQKKCQCHLFAAAPPKGAAAARSTTAFVAFVGYPLTLIQSQTLEQASFDEQDDGL